MKEITLSTNMHCGHCVDKLGKVLNAEPRIHHWQADVASPQKTVTVHGDVSASDVQSLIEKAGFEVNGNTPAACDMNAAQTAQPAGFWQDKKVWLRASFNTLNCLTGCTIGDFAMVVFLQAHYPHTPMWLQMLLATAMGLLTSVALETSLLRYREKLVWRKAFGMAVSMSFLSMVAMELAMNTMDFMITGGKAQLATAAYWLAFVPAAVAGFLTPLPYNYYQLKKHNKACH